MERVSESVSVGGMEDSSYYSGSREGEGREEEWRARGTTNKNALEYVWRDVWKCSCGLNRVQWDLGLPELKISTGTNTITKIENYHRPSRITCRLALSRTLMEKDYIFIAQD